MDFSMRMIICKRLTFGKKVLYSLNRIKRLTVQQPYGDMEGNKTGVGESDMKRKKRGKQTLKRKMLSILLLCAMSCILAVVIVSYMTIRMIRNDSIQESMQIYLEQITREMDNDYYDMIGIVNQMSPNGLIGSVTERYLSAEDNYDRYSEQKSLREELIKLGYVNTKLLGIAYFDPKEQKELIGNFNVRVLDPSYQTISKVVVGAENIMQLCMHPIWGSGRRRYYP